MNKVSDFGVCVALFLVFSLLTMKNVQAQDIWVENSYVRATIPGTSVSSVYMDIINKSSDGVRLIGASSNVSSRIEIHEHTIAEGLMKMRKRDSIDINAHDKVSLKPSGYHLMIFDLAQLLKPSEQVTMTLHFANQKSVKVEIPVRSIKQKKQSHHHH